MKIEQTLVAFLLLLLFLAFAGGVGFWIGEKSCPTPIADTIKITTVRIDTIIGPAAVKIIYRNIPIDVLPVPAEIDTAGFVRLNKLRSYDTLISDTNFLRLRLFGQVHGYLNSWGIDYKMKATFQKTITQTITIKEPFEVPKYRERIDFIYGGLYLNGWVYPQAGISFPRWMVIAGYDLREKEWKQGINLGLYGKINVK